MLKLFFRYRRKIFRKYDIILMPLFLKDVTEIIGNVEDKSNTILLLDGFDEDPYAIMNYAERLEVICNVTELFYKVIITCRTQFFSNSASEPKYTGKIRFGIGNKGVEFVKCYISPFNEKEIDLYLRKKYNPLFERAKIKRAKSVIEKCPDLMVRPMLLSFIDNLIIDSSRQYKFVSEIYDQLVSNWIIRECTDEKYACILRRFSIEAAKHMYFHETMYITENEIDDLCAKKKLQISKMQAKSKSLLNRTADGNYKFAHRSIFEYFLAYIAFEDIEFSRVFVNRGFSGYSMAEYFLREMSYSYLTEQSLKLDHSVIKAGDFQYLQLPHIRILAPHFEGCDFEGCNLYEADLKSAYFRSVNLSYANLKDAKLELVRFHNVSLEEADLRCANLKGVEMKNVNVQGSIWLKEDVQRNVQQLKNAIFSYLIIVDNNVENRVVRVVYRNELFPDEKT